MTFKSLNAEKKSLCCPFEAEPSMKIGLFGFPMTGKSTLFQILTGVEPSAHAAPGEAQLGMTRVPDPRLTRLSSMFSPKKTTPATIEYLDLAGMEKGQAAKVLPLDQLRNADALAQGLNIPLLEIQPIQQNATTGRIVKTSEKLDQCCLACTIWAEQRKNFASVYLQADIVEGLETTRVGFCQAVDGDHWMHKSNDTTLCTGKSRRQ